MPPSHLRHMPAKQTPAEGGILTIFNKITKHYQHKQQFRVLFSAFDYNL